MSLAQATASWATSATPACLPAFVTSLLPGRRPRSGVAGALPTVLRYPSAEGVDYQDARERDAATDHGEQGRYVAEPDPGYEIGRHGDKVEEAKQRSGEAYGHAGPTERP